MKFKVLLILFCILSPFIIQTAEASTLSTDEKTLTDIVFNNPNSNYHNTSLDLSNNNTDLYNNYNYTNMSQILGNHGKYITPLTPTINARLPVNKTTLGYASIFTLNEKMYDGASQTWIRLPFYMDFTNINIRVWQLESSDTNITTYNNTAITFNRDVRLIWNITYTKTTDFYNFIRWQNITTFDGQDYNFIWVKVNAPLTAVNRYCLQIVISNTTAQPTNIYLSEGDSFGDNSFKSWFEMNNNASMFFNFDFDIVLFVENVLHNGLTSVLKPGGDNITGYLDVNNIAGTIQAGDYLNCVIPFNRQKESTNSITLTIILFFSDLTQASWFTTRTDRYNESYIVESNSLALWIGKTIVSANFRFNCSDNITFFLTDDDSQTSGEFNTIVRHGKNNTIQEAFNMELYGYFSLDSFQISNTRNEYMLIPYNNPGTPQESLNLIHKTLIRLSVIDANNAYYHTVSHHLENALKIYTGVILFPLKAIDLLIDNGGELWTVLKDYLPGGGFLDWVFTGLENFIGFIYTMSEIIMPYVIYSGYMLVKFVSIMMGLLIGFSIINAAEASTKGLIKKNILKELALEFKRTWKNYLILITIASFILTFMFNLINLAVPL